MAAFDVLGRHLGLPPGGVLVLVAVAALLVVVTAFRVRAWRRTPRTAVARQRVRSIATWWLLLTITVLALAFGRPAVIFAVLAISLLGLREGLRLVRLPNLYPWAVGATTALYAWAWFDASALFLRVVPLLGIALGALAVLRRGGLALVFLCTVLGPSYTVAVASLSAPPRLPGREFGWLLLLLLLTETHDAAQAWWGRTLGARALAPRLSPHKTWEGLWGGLATTALVAAIVGPLLAPLGAPVPTDAAGLGASISAAAAGAPGTLRPAGLAAALGVAIGLAGTAGDLLASSLKRRAGVKDSSDLVPGHGGVLDRFDSLAATAPVFFLLVLVVGTNALAG